MIIDTHTHIFDEKIYQDYFAKAKGRVNKALVLHHWFVEDERGRVVEVYLQDVLRFAASKDNLSVVGSVNVNGDIEAQLKNLGELFEEKRIVGIKLYPGYQYFYPSDEKIYPIAALCEKYKKPLIFHSGDVWNPEGGAMLKYSHPIHIDGLAVKFPKCKIVIAHFGFPYHIETANVVSKNKNVYTEISATIDKSDSDKEAEKKLHQYTQDLRRVFSYFSNVKAKTMFGTDYGGEATPLNQVEPYIQLVEQVFSKQEQEKVFYKLADELFLQ